MNNLTGRSCIILSFVCLCSVALFDSETYVNVAPLIRTFDVSRKTCAVDCFCQERCSQIVYDSSVQQCRMYESSEPVTCTSATPDITYLTSYYGITADMCSGAVKYCPEMKSINYSVMYGNVNNVGTKRKLSCVPPYTLVGADKFECLSDGTWSSEDQQCVMTCSPLNYRSNVECLQTNGLAINTNGPIEATSTLRYLEGSTLTLRCVNTTAPVVATCTEGQWINTPVCAGEMRQFCGVDTECLDTDTECRNNVCWCKPGLSYDRTTSACVSSCTNYGDTYQEVENYAMFRHDIECTKTDIFSLDDCIALCYSKTTYTCVTLEMGLTSFECCMRDLVPSDIAARYFKSYRGYTYVQRDCE